MCGYFKYMSISELREKQSQTQIKIDQIDLTLRKILSEPTPDQLMDILKGSLDDLYATRNDLVLVIEIADSFIKLKSAFEQVDR